MADELTMPNTGARVPPLQKANVNPYVRAEYDKATYTWGIPNNLIKTMAWLPSLALTEVAYANSFIFDTETYAPWPSPNDPAKTVVYPMAGFVDRVTKELVISLVSLMNWSRYSITHHSVIGFNTLSAELQVDDAAERKAKAEAMLLNLVDGKGNPGFRASAAKGIYSPFQLSALDIALATHRDAHSVTDAMINTFRSEAAKMAASQIAGSAVAAAGQEPAYVDAYVTSMLVELTWCICHFNGLLNSWFTVLRVMDEVDPQKDELDFVAFYNTTVPETIRRRNNELLGPNGWGG